MKISKLRIKNFRNYIDQEIIFSNNINYILGDNAQGKTNLLESIFYILNGESFKNIKEEELFNKNINQENRFFKIILEVYKGDKKNTLVVTKKEKKKELFINGIKRELKNNPIKTIIFVPDDMQIIKDGPAKRREFLDNEIKIIYSNYRELIKKYNKLLSEKNYLLKNNKDIKLIRIFNLQLAESGREIIKYRLAYLKKITPIAREIYKKITEGNELLSINYKPTFNFNNYEEELENNLQEELRRKHSTIGIHRDDIVFYINKENSKDFASQGQQRSIILSLKIAELEYLKKNHDYFPILLLDDVFSELDEKRKNMLIKILKDYKIQSFISLANLELIKNQIEKEDGLIKIVNGTIV